MKQGDIVIIEFPFSDLAEKKIRPAVVLSNATYNKHHNVILAGIYGKENSCSVEITNKDLVSKRLVKKSFISLQNIFSADKKVVGRVIDSVSEKKLAEVIERTFSYFER